MVYKILLNRIENNFARFYFIKILKSNFIKFSPKNGQCYL